MEGPVVAGSDPGRVSAQKLPPERTDGEVSEREEAGGGEPGKAYLEYCKAMETANIDALRNLVIAERAKDLDRPEMKEMLPMMKELRAKEIKITGGTGDASSAWLQVTGKETGGTASTGEVEMKLEGGKWKVVKESWKSKM